MYKKKQKSGVCVIFFDGYGEFLRTISDVIGDL